VGGPAFTLTVNGSNFVSTSVVKWNGSSRTTTFVNSGQLTAQIPGGDIAAGGSAAITVFNPAPGGGNSNPVSFSIRFAPRFAYVVNNASDTVASLTVDTVNGQLQYTGYALTGSGPTAVAGHPSGKFAYVAN